MRFRRSCLPAIAAVAIALSPGCGSRSFDPAAYSRACKVDGDCMLVKSITDCNTCCAYTGVNRAAAAEDYEDVRDACSSGETCTMKCDVPKVSCVDSLCTLSPEPR
jgi:hypothetical protein